MPQMASSLQQHKSLPWTTSTTGETSSLQHSICPPEETSLNRRRRFLPELSPLLPRSQRPSGWLLAAGSPPGCWPRYLLTARLVERPGHRQDGLRRRRRRGCRLQRELLHVYIQHKRLKGEEKESLKNGNCAWLNRSSYSFLVSVHMLQANKVCVCVLTCRVTLVAPWIARTPMAPGTSTAWWASVPARAATSCRSPRSSHKSAPMSTGSTRSGTFHFMIVRYEQWNPERTKASASKNRKCIKNVLLLFTPQAMTNNWGAVQVQQATRRLRI